MTSPARQATLERAATLEGIGLHGGTWVRVTLRPADAGHGIVFVRTDLPGEPRIRACHEAVNEAALQRRTELIARNGDGTPAAVGMTEHLLAACLGLGIDNLLVELDGPELPILDGSGRDYATALAAGGVRTLGAPRGMWRLRRPVEYRTERAEIQAVPAESMHLAFFCELAQAGMPSQSAAYNLEDDDFATAVAPARTFVFYEDVEKLRAAGLIRGGSLDCAIVIRDGRPYQTDYRLPNELACHKLLDLMGDLAVLGRPVGALITARGTGHALHHAFVARLREELYE